jgi:hypothetical protein
MHLTPTTEVEGSASTVEGRNEPKGPNLDDNPYRSVPISRQYEGNRSEWL